MAEFDMVNGILLTGNLVIWVALCLRRGESAVWGRMGALRTKAAGAKGAAGTLPHGGGNGAQGDRGIGRGAGNGRLAAPEARFAESLVGFLEFAVYGRDDTDGGFDSAGNRGAGRGERGAVCGQGAAGGEHAALVPALEDAASVEGGGGRRRDARSVGRLWGERRDSLRGEAVGRKAA